MVTVTKRLVELDPRSDADLLVQARALAMNSLESREATGERRRVYAAARAAAETACDRADKACAAARSVVRLSRLARERRDEMRNVTKSSV